MLQHMVFQKQLKNKIKYNSFTFIPTPKTGWEKVKYIKFSSSDNVNIHNLLKNT
jgi:hypothetical protein